MDNINELQEATRAHIRTMLRLTGWSPSRLADAAGLASSTLNRFLNQKVKYNISQRTMALLISTTLREAARRIENDRKNLPDSFEKDLFSIRKLANLITPEDVDLLENEFYTQLYDTVSGNNKAPDDGFGQWGLSKQDEKEVSQYLAKELAKRQISRIEGEVEDEFQLSSAVSNWISSKISERSVVKHASNNMHIPVVAEGLKGTRISQNSFGNIIATTLRPPFLLNPLNGFAVYIISSKMEPRYSPRSLVYAHPQLDDEIENGAYYVLETVKNGIIVCRVSGISENMVTIDLLSPAQSLTLPRSEITLFARIVGSADG